MADDGTNGNMDTFGSQQYDEDRKLPFAGGLAQEDKSSVYKNTELEKMAKKIGKEMQDTEYNMSVKKTSLQGEVDTLVSTLKQLTILKHEAQRKLDDLDAQYSGIMYLAQDKSSVDNNPELERMAKETQRLLSEKIRLEKEIQDTEYNMGQKKPQNSKKPQSVKGHAHMPARPATPTPTEGPKNERKFDADGIFKAKLNKFLSRELAKDGYSGVEVRVAPTKTEIIIMAIRTQNVLGEKGRRIRELASVIQKKFNLPKNSVQLYAEKVATSGLCANAQAESLRYKLMGGLTVHRACNDVLRYIMESGAKGCEVVVSRKHGEQRARELKFVDGLMMHCGDPYNDYVDTAFRHVLLRQGDLGIKVKILLSWDPTGKKALKKPLLHRVSIAKDEHVPANPHSESKGAKPDAAPVQM